MQDAAETGQVFTYLTQPEVRFLDAVAARLIPADDLGPGGKEAGVSTYIDRQLGSVWGSHGRNYRQGPWPEGSRYQGFQSRLTPREIYRAGIREINVHCLKQYQKAFEFLAPAEQDEVLKELEAGRIEIDCDLRRGSSSGCSSGTRWKASSPIPSTAAIATRWAGSSSASRASRLPTTTT